MKSQHWVVHKFGGTSVAGADRYRKIWDILKGVDPAGVKKAVVVSAMSGVTDRLLAIVDKAKAQDDSYVADLDALRDKHVEVLTQLVPPKDVVYSREVIDQDIRTLKEVLRGVRVTRNAPELTRELVAGHGEIWSATILSSHWRGLGIKAPWLDARQVLVVTGGKHVQVDWEESSTRLLNWMTTNPEPIVVITGFIASTGEGLPTTLKRNGSDYSATIFARLLKADSCTIWTDVDGVLSADPREVPEAILIDELSYTEATELAYFGAKVVHPSTMGPAVESRIPIRIKNTFFPEKPGTIIQSKTGTKLPVKGVTSLKDVALIDIEGSGMVGVPGMAERVFAALRSVDVSAILISQASSEYSLSVAVPPNQGAVALDALNRAFVNELRGKQIDSITCLDKCATLSIVGDNMASHPGTAAAFFGALGRAGINIRAIAQAASERNISAVIDGGAIRKALRVTHAAFYLSRPTYSIGLLGCGRVGGVVLEQIAAALPTWREKLGIEVRVSGILSSTKMILDPKGLDLAGWREKLDQGEPANLDAFLSRLPSDEMPHTVLIDSTASTELPARYPDWMKRGFHVITPNKVAGSGAMDFYRQIFDTARATGKRFHYETTVGGGLPILRTARSLVETGDRVLKVEGVLSGTLSFLFNQFNGTQPFSGVVRQAFEKGYTEPDPRVDLSGLDVARKLVILARELGFSPELSDVAVKDLVAEPYRALSVDEWWKVMPNGDTALAKLVEEARLAKQVVRFVGSIDENGKASVGIFRYPFSHPFARLTGADNIVAFKTARYHDSPLIVQGPGAGPAVTAGGILADFLRLSAQLGARA